MVEAVSRIFSQACGSWSLSEKVNYGSWFASRPSRTQQSSTPLSHWNFSPLRLLWLGGLFAGVRGAPFPPKILLGTLDGTIGFAIDGVSSYDRSGFSLFNAGDLNGDGVADVVIGAPDSGAYPLFQQAGETYVVFGQNSNQSYLLSQLANLNGKNGFVLRGELPLDGSGTSISGACDLNNDTYSDLVIGAKGSSSHPGQYTAGRAYVIFGGPKVGEGGVINFSSLNGTNGLRFVGEHIIDQAGHSVACGRDINGDNVDDLAIGAFGASPSADRQRAGQTYVVFGHRHLGNGNTTVVLSRLNGTDGFVLNGEESHDNSGNAISFIGDFNGDKIGDLVIGAIAGDPTPDRLGAGRAYIVYGHELLGADGVVELSDLGKGTGIVLHGEVGNDFAGSSLAGPGDVNHDGTDDVLIGAHWADAGTDRQESGRTYVLFGQAGLDKETSIELSDLHVNQTLGFVINGESAQDLSGTSVSGAGDFNGDEIPDFMIGGNLAQSGTLSGQAGKAYIVFGSRFLGATRPFELSLLNGENGIILQGEQNTSHTGWAVAGGGDVNGDGIPDAAISAPSFSPSIAKAGAGRTYILFGRNTTSIPTTTSSITLEPSSTHNLFSTLPSTSRTKTTSSVTSTKMTTSTLPHSTPLSTWSSMPANMSPNSDSPITALIAGLISLVSLACVGVTIFVCTKKNSESKQDQYGLLEEKDGSDSSESSSSASPQPSPRVNSEMKQGEDDNEAGEIVDLKHLLRSSHVDDDGDVYGDVEDVVKKAQPGPESRSLSDDISGPSSLS